MTSMISEVTVSCRLVVATLWKAWTFVVFSVLLENLELVCIVRMTKTCNRTAVVLSFCLSVRTVRPAEMPMLRNHASSRAFCSSEFTQ